MRVQGIFCLFSILVIVESRYKEQHRPCLFNPLCTCSSGGPDLGSVCCHNIPFMTVPRQINNSAIYIMSLKNNKLRFLEDNSLNGTGLWKLQINDNLLTDLPSNALAGLEKTLSILDLNSNELVRVPKEAIQRLEKINNLNLAGNHISSFQSDDFESISNTLKVLDLSENSITNVQNDIFKNMAVLEDLNLAYNVITSIEDFTLQNKLYNLRRINLMGNQLHEIPFNMLTNLRNLKILNLNENLLFSLSEGKGVKSRINLEEIHLQYNLITELLPESFKNFNNINRLFLAGNPINIVNNTFLTTNTTELYMSHCSISFITENAFYSVSHTLQTLDLSYNNLLEFPSLPLKKLVKLSLAGNKIGTIQPDDVEHFGTTLKYLDIRGSKMNGISSESMQNLPNLRELLFNKQKSNINHQFLTIGPSMEKLYIVRSSIESIESGSFQQLGGLKYLDLSYNKISKIGNATFKDVGHSLEKIFLHNALKMSSFPYRKFNHLLKLQDLDLSNNNLQYLPQASFAIFQNLKNVNLNHNDLKNLEINFVNGINNPNLLQLKIAFNKITSLKSNTFRDLQNLVHLQLNDNLIKVIEKSSFLNLDSLISINLEGNFIEEIENEAFQNLPNIQFINVAYNKLIAFNLEAFDQVGRLSTLRIDVDHNEIQNLTAYYISSHTSSNIRNINFRNNNISYIDNNYFDPIRLSINVLDFSNNQIPNLTNSALAEMMHLQTLILRNNLLDVIEENEFRGQRGLQILDMSQNNIKKLPSNLFEEQNKLRIFLASHNIIENLPRTLFSATVLEQLDLSYNSITEFPIDSLLEVKETLQSLELSGNQIKSFNFSHIEGLQHLRHLSISKNRIFLPGEARKFRLPKLISLDISHNIIEELPQWIINSLPNSLESLNLANTSLISVPILDTNNILILNLSLNNIQTIQSEAFEHLKNLQILDFSNNLLQNVHNNIWSNLHHIRSLYLQSNPIQTIQENSFRNMENLQELIIKNLKVKDIQKAAFHRLTALRRIEMDLYSKLKNIDISQLLQKNNGLREIHLHIQDKKFHGFDGNIPKSVKSVILEGENLKHIDESALINMQTSNLKLDIRNTSLLSLSKNMFYAMNEVKNFAASFRNNKLQTIERIPTAFEKGTQSQLQHLELSGNQLHCDCQLAWIWEWIQEYDYQNSCSEINCAELSIDDLRESKCINMNKSVIDAFKIDLDCFSNGVQGLLQYNYLIFNLVIITLYAKRFFF